MFTRWSDAKTDKSPNEPQLTAFPPHDGRAAAPAVIMAPPPAPQHQHQQAQAQATPPPIPAELASAMHAEQVRSVIGQDLSIEGQAITIRCKGALEINGSIQAELHSQKLVVGQSGRVEGTIAAETVDIWGRVNGTVMGSRVVLHPSADVEGDIHARSLSVADGASFEGRSRKVMDDAAIAPRLDAGAAPITPTGSEPLQFPKTIQ